MRGSRRRPRVGAASGVDAVVLERGRPRGLGRARATAGRSAAGSTWARALPGPAGDGRSGADRSGLLAPDASDAFSLIERLIAPEEGIECFWQKRGRFVGAWTPAHYGAQESRVAGLNAAAGSGALMVPRERQREEIATDYYYGGMVVERSAKLHPALYYKGLLDAARRREIAIYAEAPVEPIGRPATAGASPLPAETRAGDVVIATNGYTGDATPALRRRLVPLASHIIATEKLRQTLPVR